MHQVWLDWMGERALPQGSFEDIRELAPELRTLITGDLHESRLEWFSGEAAELTGLNLQILSPGSTCMQSVAEPLQKYMYYLSEGEDGLPEFEQIELKSRPFVRMEVGPHMADVDVILEEAEEQFEAAFDYADANKLPEEICTPIFHFTYPHEVADHVHRIEKHLDGRAHIFWKEIPAVVEDDVYTEGFKAGVSATMADMLHDTPYAAEIPDALALAERLLATPDAAEELTRWRREKVKKLSEEPE